MSAASSGSSSPSSASCALIMSVDLGLDRVGAGQRRFLGHQRGRRAEREAGDVPQRLERGRAHAPLGHQRVEAVEMPLLLRRHARDQLGFGAIAAGAPPAGRRRSGSRHIRRPGRRAASRRGRGAGRLDASRSWRAALRLRKAISAAPPSERMAFQPAIEMPRNDHCTWSQRTSGVAEDVPASGAPLPVAVQAVRPSKIPSSTPA